MFYEQKGLLGLAIELATRALVVAYGARIKRTETVCVVVATRK